MRPPPRRRSRTGTAGVTPGRRSRARTARHLPGEFEGGTPFLFINRELSWLAFNARVLEEAQDETVPTLERLKFLAIVSSNLDEFFMVRVAGLKRLVEAGVDKPCPAGLTPGEQLREIGLRVRPMVRAQGACFARVKERLAAQGLRVLALAEAAAPVREWARRFFREELYPVLTPVRLEAAAEAPTLAGLALHVAVLLEALPGREGGPADDQSSAPDLAVVRVPVAAGGTPRLIQAAGDGGATYLTLESIVRGHVGDLFPGRRVIATALFRLTRDADLEVNDEEVSDLLPALEGVLAERRRSRPVRLEIEAEAPVEVRRRLASLLGLEGGDVYAATGPIDLSSFRSLVGLAGYDHLRDPAYQPMPPPRFAEPGPVWPVLREGEVLLHHPYDSFEPVIRFLNQAADDPQVLAVKQTLYRTSGRDSPVIAALERAARNGKQVTVLVELRARFEEARNIDWARRLENAGCQVLYGVTGLKTHGKLCLVVRREAGGVRRYVHLSTGNYNEVTARVYEDVGFMTASEEFGADASALFNAITGYSETVEWRRFVVAPQGMSQRLVELIEREAQRSAGAAGGLIRAKLNALADPPIIRALYRASQAGVVIQLNVRGICCLRPGVPGASDTIEVVSIVDRYLEHARIFHFQNGGDDEVYLSSADWMPRNLSRRLEVMWPVEERATRQHLKDILDVYFQDTVKARRLMPDGTYVRVARRGGRGIRAQAVFQDRTAQAAELAGRARLSRFQPHRPPEHP